MFRPRKNPTPGFRMATPFQPMSGEHAALRLQGIYPYCSMMQIAAPDTIDDYVICRGFDTRIGRFIDYAAGDPNKPGIAVAKPYGKRSAGVYQVAEIYLALLPLQTDNASPSDVPWRVGQNPGVAAVTQGHPADLNELVDFLKDASGTYINWMLVDSTGVGTAIEFTIDSVTGSTPNKVALVTIRSRPCGSSVVPEEAVGKVYVHDPSGCFFDEANAALVGRWGGAQYMDPEPPGGDDCEWRVTWLCCPTC